MAHNIEIKENGKASVFVTKEAAWHGEGIVVQEAQTAQEAIRLASLDYTVEKKPLYLIEEKDSDFNIQQAPRWATVRADTGAILGTVGSQYEILQNTEAFSFFDELVDNSAAIYETAGVLGSGERAWILAKMPDYIRVGKDDVIEKYVLLSNSHDGSRSVQAMLTPIRVVCENTLNAALNTKDTKISVRHSSSIHVKIKEAHKILGLYDMRAKEIEALYQSIQKKAASDAWVKKTLTKLIPDSATAKNNVRTENVREDILNFYHQGIGQENITGNRWGFYNGVTGWVDHNKYQDKNKAFKYSMFGNGQDFKAKALKLCLS